MKSSKKEIEKKLDTSNKKDELEGDKKIMIQNPLFGIKNNRFRSASSNNMDGYIKKKDSKTLKTDSPMLENKKVTKSEIQKIEKMLPPSPNKSALRDKYKNIKSTSTNSFISHASFFDINEAKENGSKKEKIEEDNKEDHQQKETTKKLCIKERKQKRRHSEPFWHSWNYHVNSSFKVKMLSNSKDATPRKKKSSLIMDRDSPIITGSNSSTTAVMVEKNGKNLLIEVSFSKLIDFCVGDDLNDNDFLSCFLLTHKYFSTSIDVLEELERRYFSIAWVENEDPSHKNVIVKKLRVINVLKKWLGSDYLKSDVIGDKELEEKFVSLFDKIKDESSFSEKWATRLKESYEAPLHYHEVGKDVPPPILPININTKGLEFCDVHPLEIARQLALIEFKLFESIKPCEFFRCAWSKKNAQETAPNVMAMTKFFNQVSFWLATEIVQTPNLEKRVEIVTRMIQLGEYSLSLNNYNGLMEIYCALSMSPISRLKDTWSLVPESYIQKYNGFAYLLKQNQNYKNYRSIVEDAMPPLIPFQGVYQADLTMFAETPDFTEKTGNINFEKMYKMGKVYKQIELCQLTHYDLTPVAYIADFIMNGVNSSKNNDELYKLSLEIENSKTNPSSKLKKIRNKTRFGKKEVVPDWLKTLKSKNPLMDILVERAINEKKLK
eukprot:TRINITY_DN2293_c0_g1_i1.p1 TRINITY_DN2293_c0_g1~~TRINITY_DN2293_c0_g1_i1.p1  ORF type:complete len:664 (-),score=214.51 TRINITY_DN2293_c0_g1_i1:76-2067(-)